MDENRKIIVEMKSVNHRYCDINIKMPKKLNFLNLPYGRRLKYASAERLMCLLHMMTIQSTISA